MKKHQLREIEKESEHSLQEIKRQTETEILEFNSVEDLIRHDAKTVKLPETLWERVKKSVSSIPQNAPFWKKLFKK